MGTGTPEGLRIAIYSQDSFGPGRQPSLRRSLYPDFSPLAIRPVLSHFAPL